MWSLGIHAIANAQPPHILLVVADDYGYNDVGYHQKKGTTTNVMLLTPTLDRLASEGRTLENYYVQPLCSPTRGTIMTGRYPSHTGIGPSVIRCTMPYAMPKAEVLLPELLKRDSYQTHMIGKWHLGLCDERMTPTYRGFDSFTGYLLGAEDYFNHTRSDSGFTGLDLRNSTTLSDANTMPPTTHLAYGTYSTDVFVSAVERVVGAWAEGDAPLFVYLPFQSVHAPLQAPAKYIDKYPASMNKNRRTYAGMVSALDDAVARVEAAYVRAGIWNNTLLVFTTDNGGPSGSANNFPLRGHKATAWEGGVHGVAFVRGYGIPAGTTTKELMHSTDWLPTLAGLAGAAAAAAAAAGLPLDGVDQWGVLARGEPTTRTMVIHNSPGANESLSKCGGALRLGRFKYLRAGSKMQVKGGVAQTPPPGFTPPPGIVCAPPRAHPPLGEWLFDIKNDPYECTNLAQNASHAADLRRITAAFAAYRRSAVPDLASSHHVSDPAADPTKRADGAWGPWSDRSSMCVYK